MDMTILSLRRAFSDRARLVSLAILVFSAYCAYEISLNSPINAYAAMDPRTNTLVAQALIQHGTIRVDGYKLPAASWLFEVRNGHTYSIYPLGTPLFALPFVAIALSQGSDMQIDELDFRLQKQVAGLTLLAFMFLAYLILRCFGEPVTSALLAGGWTLGSGVMSTMGAALWSINFTVFFECLVLLILVRYFSGKTKQLRPFLLGCFLFAAYLCRPSAALLAVPTAVLVWKESKNASIKLTAVFLAWLLVLCLFSLREFGTWLPDYYLWYGAGAVQINFRHWRNALYGLTFGPARGIFVYQPFLVLIFIASIFALKKLWKNSLFWFSVSWIVLDLLLVSRWSIWWGGGSFGSRLLVESLPGCVILTAVVWEQMSALGKTIVPFALSFGMLFGVSIFINSYQGLYNWSTWEWNGMRHSLGRDPKNNYDWRYPQFLANPEMMKGSKTEDVR
jgi:hypothetical protein